VEGERRRGVVRKRVAIAAASALAGLVLAPVASPTIHPIVESPDCANERAFEATGDPADPPGQTPFATPGNGQNELRAIQETAGRNPTFGHGDDGECGKVGPPPK
jgi:hypothetical protein